MRTLETTVTVGLDRTATLHLPQDLPPGQYRVIVVIDDAKPAGLPPTPMLQQRMLSSKSLPPDVNLRGEDES